jgi:integrase
MLTNSGGKPWSESGFQGAWRKAPMRAGIRGLTFHDVRGTAVLTLARAGCNEVEIYSITCHKPGDVRAILNAHYLPKRCRDCGQCDCEAEPVQDDARRPKGRRKTPD